MMKVTLLKGKLKLYTEDLFGRNAQNLLLAAHGGVAGSDSLMGIARRVAGMHYFEMHNWTTLFFYAPHGSTTRTRLDPYMQCRYPPLEAVMPGESIINYDLRHIAEGLSYVTDPLIKSLLLKNRCNAFQHSSEHPFRLFDIVTTEPSGPAGTCLEEVLYVLFQAGRTYPRIHCTFCRHEYGAPMNEYTPGYHNLPSSKR